VKIHKSKKQKKGNFLNFPKKKKKDNSKMAGQGETGKKTK